MCVHELKLRDFNVKFSRVLVIVCIAVLVASTVVYALDSQPFTINLGVYPGAPSFTVWEQDGTYFAKNSFGVIAYSGTDAETVINSALSAQSYQTVYLMSGQYVIDSPIYINNSGVSLIGEGSYATFINVTGAGVHGIIVGNMVWLGSIEKLRIQGDGTNEDGLYLDGTRRGSIVNCDFSANGGNGIYGTGNFKMYFENINSDFNGGHGIYLNTGVETVGEITMIRISSGFNDGSGIYLTGIANCDLIDSTGEGNGVYGLYVSGSPVFVSGSNFESNTQDQVRSGAQGVFTACYFHGAPVGYYGLSLFGENRSLTVISPRFASNDGDIEIDNSCTGMVLISSTPPLDQLDIDVGPSGSYSTYNATLHS